MRACDFEDSIGVYDLDSPAIPAEWSSNSAGHIYSEGPKRCDIVDKRIVCVCVCVISVSFGASGNLMFCLCFEHRFNDNINWPKLVLTFWIAPHTGRNGASLSPKFRWRPKCNEDAADVDVTSIRCSSFSLSYFSLKKCVSFPKWLLHFLRVPRRVFVCVCLGHIQNINIHIFLIHCGNFTVFWVGTVSCNESTNKCKNKNFIVAKKFSLSPTPQWALN